MEEFKEAHNEHENHNYDTKGENMSYAPTTGNIPLTAPLGGYGGYGLFGGHGEGNGFLAYQNNQNMQAIGNQGEFTRRDIASHNLNNTIGQNEIKSDIKDQTLLDTIASNRDTASIKADIAGQTAMFEGRLNGIENQATLRRELDCQTAKIMQGQELQAKNILLDAYQNPKPAITTGCPVQAGSCGGNDIDVNAIQIAVGNGIAQAMAPLVASLQK